MAAIAYPYLGSGPAGRGAGGRHRSPGGRGAGNPGHLRLVSPPEEQDEVVVAPGCDEGGAGTRRILEQRRAAARRAARRAELRRRRWTRLAPTVGSLALVAVTWFGSGLLAKGGGDETAVHLAGAETVEHAQLYVARPGDTLWSIASRVEPGADPRPLVAALAAQLHGAPLEAGMTVRLP